MICGLEEKNYNEPDKSIACLQKDKCRCLDHLGEEEEHF